MNVQVYFPLSQQVYEYLVKLQDSLKAEFGLAMHRPQGLELLHVPVKSEDEHQAVDIVLRFIEKSDFGIRLTTKYNTEQISLTNGNIEISVDEKSWNAIVDFQKWLLGEIEQYIDVSNPIIVKKGSHHSERPLEYIGRYGTDNVLNWYGASLILGREKDLNKRREVYQFISENHPLDVKMKGKAEVRVC